MKFKGITIVAVLLALSIAVGLGQTRSSCPLKLNIAVIDTGLNIQDPRFKDHLCKSGHKNFVESETLDDVHGHGTFVAGLIQQYAKYAKYCMTVYKYYTVSASEQDNVRRELLAFKEAIKNKSDIVNFSAGGPVYNEEEAALIRNHPEITFVVAAGNEGLDIDIPGNEFYPASLFYKNMVVVENINEDGTLSFTSNYSNHIHNSEIGEHVASYFPDGKEGYMSGSSMSCAIHTGKLIFKTLNQCR